MRSRVSVASGMQVTLQDANRCQEDLNQVHGKPDFGIDTDMTYAQTYARSC